MNGTSQDDAGTSLMRMPLAGGTISTLDASPSGHRAVVLDDTHIYWTSADGTVMKMHLEDGARTTMASGQSSPFEISWSELQGS